MREFRCYSARLNRALEANGFKPICVKFKDGESYWVYELTNELLSYKNEKYQLERDNF